MLVYNNRCVIRVALNFHWVYMLGYVSSDPLVSLDHIDQGNGTQYKQGHTEWTALSYTSFNIDFACRVSIHHMSFLLLCACCSSGGVLLLCNSGALHPNTPGLGLGTRSMWL